MYLQTLSLVADCVRIDRSVFISTKLPVQLHCLAAMAKDIWQREKTGKKFKRSSLSVI